MAAASIEIGLVLVMWSLESNQRVPGVTKVYSCKAPLVVAEWDVFPTPFQESPHISGIESKLDEIEQHSRRRAVYLQDILGQLGQYSLSSSSLDGNSYRWCSACLLTGNNAGVWSVHIAAAAGCGEFSWLTVWLLSCSSKPDTDELWLAPRRWLIARYWTDCRRPCELRWV